MDLYKVLGVRRDATKEQIKSVYREIARETHPDTHPGDEEAISRYREATRAYETLGNASKRSVYDRESRPAASIQDLLTRSVGEQLMGAMLVHAPAARRNGEDQILCLPVIDGVVSIPDPRDPARKIGIPVSSTHQLCRVVEMGTPGNGGGSSGDLYILTPPKEST